MRASNDICAQKPVWLSTFAQQGVCSREFHQGRSCERDLRGCVRERDLVVMLPNRNKISHWLEGRMRPVRTNTFLILVLMLVTLSLSSCGGQRPQETPPNAQAVTETPSSPVRENANLPTEIDIPEEGRLLLNEVFPPTEDELTSFVELKNAGGTDVELEGVTIENERGDSIEIPSGLPVLGYGQVFIITLEQRSGAPTSGFSTTFPTFLSSENGTLRLFNADGTLLDHVDWGVDNPDSVRLSRGGVPPLQFPPGSSIGRHPLSSSNDPLEWTTFSQQQVTPGTPNPLPGVEILLPMDGAFFDHPDVPLAWYVVPGAREYRVQVSTDAAFESIEIDAVVESPPVSTDPLLAGDYYWRVQAVGADGVVAEFSPIHTFTIETPVSAALAIPVAYHPGSAYPLQDQRMKVLPVPQIFQKKDSNMLLLESPRAEGAHAWNVPHPGYSGGDPADNTNCALASIAMLNHYYGGDMTQDLIGWEVFKNRKPGPEMDLNWGTGLNIHQIERGLAVALPGSLLYYLAERPVPEEGFDLATPEAKFFERVVTLIEAGKPVLAVMPGHATVISGYRIRDGVRSFHLNDPTIGKYWEDAEKADWRFYFVPASEGKKDDPTIYLDYDGDGINNFDEMYRFSTNPNNPDTDRDGLNDGMDVFASVHDEIYGYSGDMNMSGRDFDDDGVPMELDFDADEGGCMDSFEDLNLNGLYDSSEHETWNFDDQDDRCWELTMDWIFADEWGSTVIEFGGNFRVAEEQKIEGLGSVNFGHSGPCFSANDHFGFTIGGMLEGETLKIEIQDIPQAEGPDVSNDLPPGCTAGKLIAEAFAVGFGGGWALPEVIEVPAKEQVTVEIDTRSPLWGRGGDLTVTIKKHGDE